MAVDSRNGSFGGTDLPEAVVEDILSSDRRRAMLTVLAETEKAVAVEDLAAATSAVQRGTPPDSVGPGTRREVVEEIYDRHLPKLLATGVVEYDSMRGAVRLVDRTLVGAL
jgi:hypothetical protein